MWANLNDLYNQDIIIIENNDLKNYIPKIEKKILINNKPVESLNDTKIIIDEIISLEYDNLNIYEVLKNQLQTSNYLIKLYKSSNDNLKWDNFNNYLQYIYATSKYILKKKNIEYKVFKTDILYRSSYKFCNKIDMCEQFYNNLKNNCNCDHYVHNKLTSDLECLISLFNKEQEINKNNLRTCLETTNFVLNHMFQELNSIKLYHENDNNFNIDNYYLINNKNKKY